jgi:hypothetical protein
VMSDKTNPPFVDMKLYRVIDKMLFVQNVIWHWWGKRNRSCKAMCTVYALMSSNKSGTEFPVLILPFHDLNRMNAQWRNCLTFRLKFYVRCHRIDEKGIVYYLSRANVSCELKLYLYWTFIAPRYIKIKKNYTSSNKVYRVNNVIDEHNYESWLKCDGDLGNEAYRWKENVPLLCLHL